MNLLSEYTDDTNRCARIYRTAEGMYQVNYWDAALEIDNWQTYTSIQVAEDLAEDWVQSRKMIT